MAISQLGIENVLCK